MKKTRLEMTFSILAIGIAASLVVISFFNFATKSHNPICMKNTSSSTTINGSRYVLMIEVECPENLK